MEEQSADTSQSERSTVGAPQALTYEETPVIEPIKEIPPAPPPHSLVGSVIMVFFFIILFVAGVGISIVLRQYLASRQTKPIQQTSTSPSPATEDAALGGSLRSPEASPTATIADPYAGWKTYQVISGVTKQPVPGISFKLPPEALAPICDGAQCASQGTYLSNGTRFTAAARGKGQLLADARGNVLVTDWSGKPFTTKAVIIIGGRKALEYAGLFSGTTVGGYTFSQMRGLMIEIDEDETLEINHFTPSGVSAEFAKDDILFDKIAASLIVARFPQVTTTISPTP